MGPRVMDIWVIICLALPLQNMNEQQIVRNLCMDHFFFLSVGKTIHFLDINKNLLLRIVMG
jgi:hypothetical protein